MTGQQSRRWRRSKLVQTLARSPYALYRSIRASLPQAERRIGPVIFSMSDPAHRRDWIYHNEDWQRVRSRFEDRRRLQSGLPVTTSDTAQEWTDEATMTSDGDFAFQVKTTTSDEWIYLYLDPQRHDWADYRWEFEVKRDSSFRELQFGFRYQDFYNRYRYRFENDEVIFDIVKNGRMIHALNRASLPMQLGRWYRVCIDAIGDRLQCSVDGRLVLADFDRQHAFPRGSIAIILWENDGRTDIRAAVRDLHVRSIE